MGNKYLEKIASSKITRFLNNKFLGDYVQEARSYGRGALAEDILATRAKMAKSPERVARAAAFAALDNKGLLTPKQGLLKSTHPSANVDTTSLHKETNLPGIVRNGANAKHQKRPWIKKYIWE